MITTLLLLFPLITGTLVLFMKKEKVIRTFVLVTSLVMFLIALYGAYLFVNVCPCNWLIRGDWITGMGISIRFGIDGISLLLILLTTFLFPLIIGWSANTTHARPAFFYSMIMLMELAFVGVFTAWNGILFYIFWEMALIPAYFICALWGGNDRIRITFKFFIYTFAGSLFMLAAFIYLYYKTQAPHSFDLNWLYMANLSSAEQNWIFLAFLIAFAVKIPIFPLHTWQPDTYTESPSEGTMLLSGVMLKMGIYGLIRFLLPLTPLALKTWGFPVMIVAVTGIVYASVIALKQKDIKRLFAYSSLAHVGMIATAVLVLNVQALQGSVLQMVAHGLSITGLFMIAGILEKRLGTRDITSMGGIALKAPWMAVYFMIIILGSIGLPLTSGFPGEFLMLLGIFSFNKILAAFAGLSIIFGAVYMLRMYQKTMLGTAVQLTENIIDLDLREKLVLSPIILMILWIGIYPVMFLKIAEPAVLQIINLIR